ncbi:MAG: GntR family transcriptional regulator [Opitutaceae bacterium]|nr:GntR family transcriptional regulator [Opitutaceae bacterium]
MDASSWKIEFHSGIPVYKQIIHQVQAAITAGRLKEGDQLPTIRALHQQLAVNPNTVAKAYRELEHLGLLSAEHGSGCFVSAPPPAPKRSATETRAKVDELSARFAAEARSHGISLEQIIQNLTQRKSHV